MPTLLTSPFKSRYIAVSPKRSTNGDCRGREHMQSVVHFVYQTDQMRMMTLYVLLYSTCPSRVLTHNLIFHLCSL